jgi:hypothetical protein
VKVLPSLSLLSREILPWWAATTHRRSDSSFRRMEAGGDPCDESPRCARSRPMQKGCGQELAAPECRVWICLMTADRGVSR